MRELKGIVMCREMREMVEKGEIHYLERLNMYYIICDVYTFDNFAERCLEVVITIDIINENTADMFHSRGKDSLDRHRLIEESLDKLLPTKRPENRGARR